MAKETQALQTGEDDLYVSSSLESMTTADTLYSASTLHMFAAAESIYDSESETMTIASTDSTQESQEVSQGNNQGQGKGKGQGQGQGQDKQKEKKPKKNKSEASLDHHESFGYNMYGQVIEHRHPDNNGARRLDTYMYAGGYLWEFRDRLRIKSYYLYMQPHLRM